jgi:hypothetical protein
VGASQIALAAAHVVIWRAFGWSDELARISPLTGRVFAVHTFFIAFVLAALGALALGRPDLLEMRGELTRLLLAAAALFWTLRLFAQPIVFDPVLMLGSRWRSPVRLAATLLFTFYAANYALAFLRQT